MNFCPFGTCPSDRMSSPVMWHTTSSYFPPAKNPCRSFAPAAHRNPSSRQRSKRKQSVKKNIRAHRCNYLPLVGGASPGLVFFDKTARTASVKICVICGRTFPCRMPHSKSHIPHLTSHIPHPTSHIPHPTFHIQRSTFSTLLPQIYTFLPVAPRPASKYAILSAFSQPSNHQSLTFQALPRHIPNTPFPTTKRHVSPLHPCPFEAPSLTFRTSIPKPPQSDTCPTPAPPSAYGLSTRPIPPPNPKNLNSPPSVSLKIPTQDLRQIFLM